MKKLSFVLLTLLLLCGAAFCGCSKEFVPDYESAVGAIFVDAEQKLPEKEKVYADFEDTGYTFDLDAACVYFFYTDADTAYAGDMNFAALTFAANLDNGRVGACGNIAYRPDDGPRNTVLSYYLYRDETGVYFSTDTYFDRTVITDGCTVTGVDYPCEATFDFRQPSASFRVICGKNGTDVSTEEYTPYEIADRQVFDLDGDVDSVTVICCGADKQELCSEVFTRENPNAVICYDSGGRFLAVRTLYFNFQE